MGTDEGERLIIVRQNSLVKCDNGPSVGPFNSKNLVEFLFHARSPDQPHGCEGCDQDTKAVACLAWRRETESGSGSRLRLTEGETLSGFTDRRVTRRSSSASGGSAS